jgi:hypothetical protein
VEGASAGFDRCGGIKDMSFDCETASDMLETIHMLVKCVTGLLDQLMQYESINQIESWMPEISRINEQCEQYGEEIPFEI